MTEEVREEGRSAVLQRAEAQYLRNRRRRLISEQYRQGYGANPVVEDKLTGLEEEEAWPET